MKAPCIEAVTRAVGRPLSAAELKGIEDRISREMRYLGRQPEALGLSHEQRLFEAAKRAADGLLADQAKKAQREALTILKHAQVEQALASFGGDKIAGLRHMLAFHADARGSVLSVESRAEAIEADAFRQMLGTLEATSPRFFGLLENPEGVRALVRALFREDTGVKEAQEGAAQFHQVAELLLQRFNEAGGKVGRLEGWALPQHHSQRRVAAAGADAWIERTTPRLDRSAYVNEDGARMTDAELQDFLRHAYETISTGGVNKLEPGAHRGVGMEANRHGESRSIHFKSADDYLAYHEEFGELSLYDVLTSHIRGMADSIAQVETFGPNPDHTFRFFRDRALQEAVLAEPARAGKIAKEVASLDNLFNYVTGQTLPVADQRLAAGFDTLRKLLVSSRLGSAVISSFPDEATMRLTAHVNNLNQMRLFRNELAALNPSDELEKRLAQRAGLGLQTMISSLNRFGDESMRNTVASKLATGVIRAQGLAAITEARRRAFGATMMSSVGQLARDVDSLGKLAADDHRILLSKGITEADWQVWRRAELEDWGVAAGDTMLTPEAIYRIPDEALAGLGGEGASPAQLRREAVTRLLGLTLEETNVAVIEPGARERAAVYGNLQRGTWKGEIARSVVLFKMTPISMVLRHWERGMSGPDRGSRAGYVVAMLLSTAVLGMLSLQVDELLRGRDPVNVNPFEGKAGVRNWIRALLKGGSLGLWGDFLLSEQTQHGQSPTAAMLGPVVGLAEETIGLTQGNLIQLMQGKDTHAGAELLKFAKGLTPGANLWYTKAVTDHLLFNQLQEMASPGYLRRMRNRAQREFGQSYYWDPADLAPERAPDLSAALGE